MSLLLYVVLFALQLNLFAQDEVTVFIEETQILKDEANFTPQSMAILKLKILTITNGEKSMWCLKTVKTTAYFLKHKPINKDDGKL